MFANQSNLDPFYVRNGHLQIAHGRDYYLSWPLYLYLDTNPDNLPDLWDGFNAQVWKSNPASTSPYTTIENLTPNTSLKDIVGYWARRGVTYDYPSRAALNNVINSSDPATIARWRFAELVRRPDDTNWWRVPIEMSPQQGAVYYARTGPGRQRGRAAW